LSPTVRSRMIKTLALLVASMSLGTLVLCLMETEPAQPIPAVDLRAVGPDPAKAELPIVQQTDVPVQSVKWRNIIVHDAGREGAGIASGCHFIVGSADRFGDGVIQATARWRRQQEGHHIHVPGYDFNANSIGIAVLCDCRRARPTARQVEALVRLLRALQLACSVSPDHVYLHSELGEQGCPGGHFPAEAIRQSLLPAAK
jgi:hypothetical protein